MTIAEHRRRKNEELKKQKLKPIRKISNTFLENTIHKSNIGALKIIWYLATILEKINTDKDIFSFEIDLREMLKYTGLTAQDIRNNLKSMQETSISFINEEKEEELMINLLPKIHFKWGVKKVELTLFSKIANLIIDVTNNYSFINTKSLMSLKKPHSLRMLPLLQKISQYSENIAKRKHFALEDLNEFFGTKYKRISEIEREILHPVKEELDKNSKLSFVYQVNFENLGRGRPKASSITIDLVAKNNFQPTLL